METKDLKLKKALQKWGVNEEEANSFIQELKKVPDTEEGTTEEVEKEEVGEEVETDKPATEEVKTEKVEEEPKTEVAEESKSKNVKEVVSDEVKGETEETQPKDNEEVQEETKTEVEVKPDEIKPEGNDIELQNRYDELKKAFDGVVARLESLTDGLKKAGVLEVERPLVEGIDQVRVPANNPIDDPMTDVLNTINHRHY